MAWFMGVDIGSANAKGVISEDGKLSVYHVVPSGADYGAAAERLRDELLAKAGLEAEDIASTVITGYGAASAPFTGYEVPDLRCCGRGIHSLFDSVRTVIDVGEQSSQVIRINGVGQVTDFAVSEKCATGSGRFLNIIASILCMDIAKIGPLSLKSKNPVTFTTGCAVFGESEAISRVAEGVPREDILAGVHQALAGKISALVDRVGLEEDCAISGGGGLDSGLVKSVAEKLGVSLLVPPHPQVVGALGAAIMAEERQGLVIP